MLSRICLGFALFSTGLLACRATEPSNRPVETCRRSCESHVKDQCTSDECARGCEFILDRVVEREADNVIRCVAKERVHCNDLVWADCAVRVGPHADGGPPAPPPPREDD